jgi:hypothetical protein
MSESKPVPVELLNASLAKVDTLLTSSQELARALDVLKGQRRRDVWIASMFCILFVIFGLFMLWTSSQLAHRADVAGLAVVSCEASNNNRKLIQDIFYQIRDAQPTPTPSPGLTPEQLADFRKAQAERKAVSDKFFAEFDRRTTLRDCSKL